MKSKHKRELEKYKEQICRQIGIVDKCDLFTNRKEFNDHCDKRPSNHKRKSASVSNLGVCSIADRAIFVNESSPKKGYFWEKQALKRKYWHRWVKKHWNLRTQKETLVHELVHFRWPYMKDGIYEFDERQRQVRRGQTFPPKHVGLSGGYRTKRGQEKRPIHCDNAILTLDAYLK